MYYIYMNNDDIHIILYDDTIYILYNICILYDDICIMHDTWCFILLSLQSQLAQLLLLDPIYSVYPTERTRSISVYDILVYLYSK
jgi:hypothetical protein